MPLAKSRFPLCRDVVEYAIAMAGSEPWTTVARRREKSKRAERMTLKNRLGGHTNSYHTYSLEEALEGIAAAGYRYVELSAVRGWTEHVPLDADAKTTRW
jgi:hypothetical protein